MLVCLIIKIRDSRQPSGCNSLCSQPLLLVGWVYFKLKRGKIISQEVIEWLYHTQKYNIDKITSFMSTNVKLRILLWFDPIWTSYPKSTYPSSTPTLVLLTKSTYPSSADKKHLPYFCSYPISGSGECQMMGGKVVEVQIGSNLKSILSLTFVDIKLVTLSMLYFCVWFSHTITP